MLTWLSVPLPAQEPPEAFTFDHPCARWAAEQVMTSLRGGRLAPGIPSSVLYGPDGGKMFGTLVVRTREGRLGYLKAFSGQLEHTWDVPGFVPPVFDREARAAIEPRGEACVRRMTARVLAARHSPAWAEARKARAQLDDRHAREQEDLARRLQQRREVRRAERARLMALPSERDRDAALRRVDLGAREDETLHRREKTRMREERGPLEEALAGFERRLRRLQRLRVAASRVVSWQLYDTYVFQNWLGESRTLRHLFAPQAPPSGTGDCAAPKLLIYARRCRWQPLALAEFWWGKAPRGGGKEEGAFYPACPEKCGTLLPFLLEGLAPGLTGTSSSGSDVDGYRWGVPSSRP